MYNMNFLVYTLVFVSLLVQPSLCSATATSHERCHPNEKKVLLKIKKAFNSSTLNRSWLPNTDCCDWEGVYCESTINYHVSSVFLMNDEFPSGSIIPDAISNLPNLTSLTLSNLTGLTGPIPFSITKLQNLNTLEISSCNLKGTIPGFLSKLNNLQYINLSNNKLTGPVPSFLSDIPGLGYIGLDRNRLTGTIPESLSKLKDDSIFLMLSHNKLSGEIPPSFRRMKFSEIDVSHNKLRGDVSMLFGRNKTVNYMNFARNQFRFNLSGVQLSPRLTRLDISHNKIYGSLPQKMIYIEWESLNVSYNRLCGPIPQGGYLQTNFGYSSFFHNRCLCGAPLAVACK